MDRRTAKQKIKYALWIRPTIDYDETGCSVSMLEAYERLGEIDKANQNIQSDDFNFKSKMLVIACAASLVATGLIYFIILCYDRHGKRPMAKA